MLSDRSKQNEENSFNPSFTGNAAMAPRIADHGPTAKRVSILLLLEMPQWHYYKAPGLSQSAGFNPSFTGNAAMAYFGPGHDSLSCRVSILLLLEMPQWREFSGKPFGYIPMFQSFFYWKCRNGAKRAGDSPLMIMVSILLLLEMPQWPTLPAFRAPLLRCFNPSFTGNAAMAKDPQCCYEIVYGFQSFFYWKCRNGRF